MYHFFKWYDDKNGAKWLIVYVYYGSDSLGHDTPKHIQYKTLVSVGVRRPFFSNNTIYKQHYRPLNKNRSTCCWCDNLFAIYILCTGWHDFSLLVHHSENSRRRDLVLTSKYLVFMCDFGIRSVDLQIRNFFLNQHCKEIKFKSAPQ